MPPDQAAGPEKGREWGCCVQQGAVPGSSFPVRVGRATMTT